MVVAENVGAEINADGDITLTANAIGTTAIGLDITGDAGGDRTLTISTAAAAGEDVNVDMLTDQFNTALLTLANAAATRPGNWSP